MTKRYYSSRNRKTSLSLDQLFWKVQHLYLYFLKRDYFKQKAGLTSSEIPDHIKHKAAITLGFDVFPLRDWDAPMITEDHIFDLIEFLFDHVSKPGEWVGMTTDSGWNYYDYDSYDEALGKAEFCGFVNSFLCDYKTGFRLEDDGTILALGSDGLRHILEADIIPFDKENVDDKVRAAIIKYRNRQLDVAERRQAIREMADVFEYLNKSGQLKAVLQKSDQADLFNIANNFAIRHHNPDQKNKYDESIWYPWMFHFYLATYHAVIRMLKQKPSGRK